MRTKLETFFIEELHRLLRLSMDERDGWAQDKIYEILCRAHQQISEPKPPMTETQKQAAAQIVSKIVERQDSGMSFERVDIQNFSERVVLGLRSLDIEEVHSSGRTIGKMGLSSRHAVIVQAGVCYITLQYPKWVSLAQLRIYRAFARALPDRNGCRWDVPMISGCPKNLDGQFIVAKSPVF